MWSLNKTTQTARRRRCADGERKGEADIKKKMRERESRTQTGGRIKKTARERQTHILERPAGWREHARRRENKEQDTGTRRQGGRDREGETGRERQGGRDDGWRWTEQMKRW